SLARQGKVSPAFGVWLSDVVFFAYGAFLLWRAERRPVEIPAIRGLWNRFRARLQDPGPLLVRTSPSENAFQRAAGRWRLFSARFPMILDDYVLRDFFVYLTMIIGAFVMLLLVFTLFE